MPRASAEERSAAYYRAGAKPPEPPRGMTPAAKRIWRAIVAGKPIDWFDSGTLPVLRRHCENMARADEVDRSLALVKPGTAPFLRLLAANKTLTQILAVSGRELRLTVRHAIRVDDMKMDEGGVVDSGEQLIGGRALRAVG